MSWTVTFIYAALLLVYYIYELGSYIRYYANDDQAFQLCAGWLHRITYDSGVVS